MKSLHDLFVDNLRRAYDAEKRLAKALPVWREAAASEELRHALQTHSEETEAQIDRLDRVFGWFGEKPKTQRCGSMKGILDDGKHVVSLDGDPEVGDAALIAVVQEAEHLEIALYGTLRTWALVLGNHEAAEALEVTLEEEKGADARLTEIASALNQRAAHVG